MVRQFLCVSRCSLKSVDMSATAISPPPPRTGVLCKILKPSRRSFGGGGRGSLKKFFPYRGFFPIEIFFHIVLACLLNMRTPFTGDVFRCFALYLAPVLNVFVRVFLYWVRPLVMLLTFTASAFGVGVYSIGCALRAPHQTLRGKLKKKISLRGFLGVRPSGTSPDPRIGRQCWSLGGSLYITSKS